MRNMSLAIAPMLDRTDRHFRYFMRQITRHTILYTEMITTGALIFGAKKRHLDFSLLEKPVVLQLGGSVPLALRDCARMAEDWGYDGINLNVGCPSERVQNGSFGACLMATPELVAECVSSMQAVTSLPVSVKHRIGIDAHDSYEFMFQFVNTVRQSGCKQFIVHARIALLSGLNPKQNLKVPPLRYHDVYQLKKDFPELNIQINGGIQDLTQAQAQLKHVDGVMIGRAACDDPFMFSKADALFFGDHTAPKTRDEIVSAMIPYIQAQGEFSRRVTRHMLNLYAGQSNAKKWRRELSQPLPVFSP